jgi:hypothetical protein
MPASNPNERQLIARAAAHQSWAATSNRTARTANAREAFLAKFEDLVDPNRELPADERARRAMNARKSYFARLALRSAQARRSAGAKHEALQELREATALLAVVAEAPPDGMEHDEGTRPLVAGLDDRGSVSAMRRGVR